MASVKKNFACDHCDAQGSITIKSKDFSENDIRSCPICGTPLLDDIEEDEEQIVIPNPLEIECSNGFLFGLNKSIIKFKGEI